jgi:hypothetical protein
MDQQTGLRGVESKTEVAEVVDGEAVRLEGTGRTAGRASGAAVPQTNTIEASVSIGAFEARGIVLMLRPDWTSARDPILEQARDVRAGLEELLRSAAAERAVAVGGNAAPLRDEALAELERFARPALSTLNVAIEQLVSPAPQPLIIQQNGEVLEFIPWSWKEFASGALRAAGGRAFDYLCHYAPEIAHQFVHLMDRLGHIGAELLKLIIR